MAKRRNRNWEKEHQSHKVVYRGIDPKLALKVKAIASKLAVSEGVIASAVIEFALRAYTEGELDLNPQPNPYQIRKTLLPTLHMPRDFEKPRSYGKQKTSSALWRVITTWRNFPPELRKELAALASDEELNVPVGELISALLKFGLTAYEYGLLKLEPLQKTTAFTADEPTRHQEPSL